MEEIKKLLESVGLYQKLAALGVRRFILILIASFFAQQTIGRRLADKRRGLPPGPLPMPMIGTFYELSEPNKPPGLHKDFYRLMQKYGPIYTLYFGANKGVVLNTPELWFEALNVKQDQTCNRPVLKSFMLLTLGQGVAMNNGPRWRAIRTMLQTSVTNKQLGEAAAPMIMEELNSALFTVARDCAKGKTVIDDLRVLTRLESLNFAMRKIFSFRFSNDMTPAYYDCQDWLRIIFEHIGQGSPSDFMPVLEYFPDKGREQYRLTCKRMHAFLADELAKHKREAGKRKPEDYDFMDAMLVAQKQQLEEKKINPETVVISDVDINVTAFDSMAGAIDTSATTMEWLIYTLINHKPVQAKLHAILDEVVGPNRLPGLEDIPKLEYLTAVLDEIVRWKHFAPQGLPHEAAEDMTLGGYEIPQGTQIFLNFYSLHMNPKYWKKPEEFRPERFLEEERELLDTILHSEKFFKNPEAYKFVPFGQGRRRCVGYGLGRIALWLKAAAYFHCFEFDSVDGQPLDLDTEVLAITMLPALQKVRVTPRPAAKLLKSQDSVVCESR